MAAKLIVALCLCACAAAGPVLLQHEEHYEPAHYEFQYSVHDPETHDIKQQKEERQGDAVHGSYSLLQPDGLTRVVDYSADKEHGFTANVRYEGQPKHDAQPAYVAPVVAKVAHVAPVAKIAVAPVAKIAYAPVTYAHAPVYSHAPVYAHAPAPAKLAYTENLGHVTFSSPIISYHH